MYLLQMSEDYYYHNVCFSESEEDLEKLIPVLNRELEQYFEELQKLILKMNSLDNLVKFRALKKHYWQTEEYKNRERELQLQFKNVLKYGLFEKISRFCDSREFKIGKIDSI